MNLVTTADTLRIVLGEVKTTTNCDVTSAWADNTVPFLFGRTQTVTNGTTPVMVVPSPGANIQRQCKEIRLHNNDTVAHNVTLQFDNNGTISILDGPVNIQPGGNYLYDPTSSTGGSASGSVLTENGLSAKISAFPAAALLDGTEVYAAVQSGGDVGVTGNDIGSLLFTSGFASSPLNAPAASGSAGEDMQLPAGSGDGGGAGGDFNASGGSGGTTGRGGDGILAGGDAGSTGSGQGGDVQLSPGLGHGAGRNGVIMLNGVPTADPAVAASVWEDNGVPVFSGNPVNAVATLTTGVAVSLVSGTAKDVITTAVTNAGVYWVKGAVYFTGASLTLVTSLAGSVSTTANSINTAPGQFGTQYLGVTLTTVGEDISVAVIGAKLTLTAGEVIHLGARGTFGVSTLSAYGEIAAIPIL